MIILTIRMIILRDYYRPVVREFITSRSVICVCSVTVCIIIKPAGRAWTGGLGLSDLCI